MSGIDGMRFMGADPKTAVDETEAVLMIALHNRIVLEQKRMNRGE